jgi:regulator of sigma D
MQSDNEAPVKVVERRAQSHREINALVETRTDTLSLLGELASKQPFTPEHSTQQLLQNFCESLIDYTATAHFQLYRHIDENKERRVAAREIAEQVYPRISETTQSFLAFNDKYDCEDHCDNMSELADDLSKLGEELADRIELEDKVINVLSAPRKR